MINQRPPSWHSTKQEKSLSDISIDIILNYEDVGDAQGQYLQVDFTLSLKALD